MNLPAVSVLELVPEDHWLTIWFNQPHIRNPLTDTMREELSAVLRVVRESREYRGITLRGRGGIFCAGGDLKAFKSLTDESQSRDSILRMSREIGELLQTVNNMPQIVVAVVEGAAMAGGFGLACCADVVLCERGARFAMTETAIGLSPAQIAPYAIQKLGFATARRLMLTAARFDGDGAYQHGFADEVAADVQALESLEAELKKQIARCAPGAIADTKALLHALKDASPERIIEIAASNFADRVKSGEAAEGISAFFDKRSPCWSQPVDSR